VRGPSAKVGTRGDDGQGIWYPKKRKILLNLDYVVVKCVMTGGRRRGCRECGVIQ